jgi:urease accessory protein
MVNASYAALLQLQQFADSALPIGGAAHSLGMETLVEAGLLSPTNIESFLRDYLEEAGAVEACYCAASCQLGRKGESLERWMRWNAELSARKLARESREASTAMGKRFLLLAATVTDLAVLRAAMGMATGQNAPVHLAAGFGLAAGALEIEPEWAAAAYLHQSVATLLSCCQRLMALGQTRAQAILWNLKPDILRVAGRASVTSTASIESFPFLPELASARHPELHTRLFIS